MNRRLLSSIALTLSLALLVFTSSDSAAQGPPARRIVADTGMVTLGPNQKLRLTLVTRGGGEVIAEFGQVSYAEGTCSGGVCTHPVVSQSRSGPVTLGQGQGASYDIANTDHGVRGLVLSNGRELRVLADVTDATTNQIIAILMNTEGDAPTLEFQQVGLRSAGQPQ